MRVHGMRYTVVVGICLSVPLLAATQQPLPAVAASALTGLVVDKVRVGSPGSRVRTTSPDDVVSDTDIYAIEVYPRNRGLPAHFLGLAEEDACGTIVVWTKGLLLR